MSTARTIATQHALPAIILCLLLVSACQPTSEDQPDDVLLLSGSLSETVQRLKPSVVRISVGGGVGTGIIVKSEGTTATIVTNAHVIVDPDAVRVKVGDAATYDAKVLGLDNDRDLAFLSICCAAFQAVPLANDSAAMTGDEVLAIGYPSGAVSGAPTVSRGIISAIGAHPHYPHGPVIQTDAALNPGNSGGPLFDIDGRVVGITTFKNIPSPGTPVERLGFAIPASMVLAQAPLLGAGQLPNLVPTVIPAEVPTDPAVTPTQPPAATATPRPTATPVPCAHLSEEERIRLEMSQTPQGANELYLRMLANDDTYRFANPQYKSAVEGMFDAYFAHYLTHRLANGLQCLNFRAHMLNLSRPLSKESWLSSIDTMFARLPYMSPEEVELITNALPLILSEAMAWGNPVWGDSYRNWIWNRIRQKLDADPAYSFVLDAERNYKAWFRGESGQ